MKQTTKEWLLTAEDDLLASKALIQQPMLTNLAAFHCQQCIEKSFKALMEEDETPFIKSHDLLRLQSLTNIQLDDSDSFTLRILNEVYIDSRYPGDLGLLPQGKPTIEEVVTFIDLTEKIFNLVKKQLFSNKYNRD